MLIRPQYLFLFLSLLTACSAFRGGGDAPNAADSPSSIPSRLEIPRLAGTPDHIFIDHTVSLHRRTIPNYCLEYSLTKRHARWVAFQAYDSTSAIRVTRSGTWSRDPAIPPDRSADKSDFQGYDRGHLVASADRRFSAEANRQTFLYTNASPQLPDFNRGIWKHIESLVCRWAADTSLSDTLYIVKGGTIADGQTITHTGPHRIAVPSYYFMAILAVKNGRYQAIAFCLEHKKHPHPYRLATHAITIDSLQRLSSIDFFPNLPDTLERTVESRLDTLLWPHI